MSDHDPYAEVADGRTWSSARTVDGISRTALVLEPTLAASAYVEVSVYVDGDGPSASLRPATARGVALAILDRAALLERGTGRTLSAEENVARGEASLRATGHAVTGDFDRDVDRAIDLERVRREDLEDRLSIALGVGTRVLGETLDQGHERLVERARVLADAAAPSEFLAEEADYWRRRHAALRRRFTAGHEALYGPAFMCDTGADEAGAPPEPPVGTTYTDADGDVVWARWADGWRCSRDGCPQCPCGWGEVRTWRPQEWDTLNRRLGDGTVDGLDGVVDAEIVDDLPESATVDMPRCPTCTSTAPHLHPAVQLGGEVELCGDPWHAQITPENTPERRGQVERLLESRLDWTRVPSAPDAGEVTPW